MEKATPYFCLARPMPKHRAGLANNSAGHLARMPQRHKGDVGVLPMLLDVEAGMPLHLHLQPSFPIVEAVDLDVGEVYGSIEMDHERWVHDREELQECFLRELHEKHGLLTVHSVSLHHALEQYLFTSDLDFHCFSPFST